MEHNGFSPIPQQGQEEGVAPMPQTESGNCEIHEREAAVFPGILAESLTQSRSVLVLYLSFILMGVCTTILGPILPELSLRWHLNDAHAGALFTAQFIGSSLGGLLAAIHPPRCTILGFLILVSGLLVLTVATPSVVTPLLFMYGLGGGLVLTGINLTMSNISGRRRGQALSWLNFCWSLGATICPVLAGVFVPRHRLGVFLLILSCWGTVMAIAFIRHLTAYSRRGSDSAQEAGPPTSSVRFYIVYFGTLLFLYVGVETVLGGWLSTLATRLNRSGSFGELAISMSSFFWLALLVGRGVFALALKWVRDSYLQPLAVACSIGSICILVAVRSFTGVAIAASLAGLSLAPVFPLSLSFFLSHADRSKSSGMVFAICGLGGAVMPWMTGALSTYRQSLEWGLVVPLGGAILMLALSINYLLLLRPRHISSCPS